MLAGGAGRRTGKCCQGEERERERKLKVEMLCVSSERPAPAAASLVADVAAVAETGSSTRRLDTRMMDEDEGKRKRTVRTCASTTLS